MAGKNNIVPSSNNNPSSDNKKKGMYKSIKIEGFRQFDKFEINDLGAINLFLGENNSGKSSILEAVYTHACGLNFNNFNQKIIYGRRFNSPNGIFDAFDRIRALFYSIESHPYKFIISMGRDILVSPDNDKREDDFITESFDEFEYIFKPSSFISLVDPRAEGYIDSSFLENEATDRSLGSFEIIDTSRSRGLKIDYKYPRFSIDNKHPQSYPAIFHNILDHRFTGTDLNVFSHLKRYNMLDNFIEEIKEAFPIIKDIDYIPYPDDNKAPVSITIEDGKQLPLYVFGDGLRRWFHILGYMTIFKNAVHCIEEIDSAFHPESQKLLAPLLLRYSKKYHNQIMLTSHSLEFADLFLASLYKDEHNELIEGEEDPVRIFTLKRDENNKLELWKRTGKKAFEMRSKFGMELR